MEVKKQNLSEKRPELTDEHLSLEEGIDDGISEKINSKIGVAIGITKKEMQKFIKAL